MIRKTPWDDAYPALTVRERDFVVVADVSEIWPTYRDRDVPATIAEPLFDAGTPRRVALDGSVFDKATPNELTGRAWEMDRWYSFRLRSNPVRVERGPLLSEERDAC